MLKRRYHPARRQPGRKQAQKPGGRAAHAPQHLNHTIFENLFESGPEAQLLVSADGRIIAANRQAVALFGYPREAMTGQPVEMLVPEDQRGAHVEHRAEYFATPYERGLSDGQMMETVDRAIRPSHVSRHVRGSLEPGVVQRELTAQRSDGSVFPVEITLNPIQDGDTLYVLSVVRDISGRRQRERAIQEQSELIRLLQDVAIAANEADSVTDAFQFVTDRLCQYLDWPVGHALLTEEDRALSPTATWNRSLPERFNDFRQSSDMMRFQSGVGLPGMVLSSGQPVWMTDIQSSPNFMRSDDARGAGLTTALAIPVLAGRTVVGVLEFFNSEHIPSDPRLMAVLPHIGVQLGRVIERKRAEEAQRKSAAQLRMVITSLPVFLWVTDRQGKIIMLEGRGVAALNVNPDELLGRSVYEISNARPELIELINRAMTGETIHMELPGGNGSVFDTFFTPYYDVNWAVDGVIGLSFDVTERKRMEGELDEMKHRLMASIENERSHLGQQIHDGPLQDLYGAFYQIQEVKNLLAEGDQEPANRALNTLQDVSATLRMICGELHPSILVHLGLQKSIRSHAEQLQERLETTAIHLDLEEEEHDPSLALPSPTRLALFRVYQSLISNATRHAQARHIWVRIRFSPKQVVMEVQDNGAGFELPDHWITLIRQGKVGLVSTLERVEALKGTMDVRTTPGKGTLVRVTVPI